MRATVLASGSLWHLPLKVCVPMGSLVSQSSHVDLPASETPPTVLSPWYLLPVLCWMLGPLISKGGMTQAGPGGSTVPGAQHREGEASRGHALLWVDCVPLNSYIEVLTLNPPYWELPTLQMRLVR